MADQHDMNVKLSTELDETQRVSSDLSKSLKELEGTSTKIDTNLKTTSSVLNETQRILDPFPKTTSFREELVIRGDQPSTASYFARIHPTMLVFVYRAGAQPREVFPRRRRKGVSIWLTLSVENASGS
jgi:hypothetical protein